MKALIKKIIPVYLIQLIRKLRFSKKDEPNTIEIKDKFTEIYNKNLWNGKESISGPGSDSDQVYEVINQIEGLLIDLNIKTILDIPCGDFLWMKKINLNNIKYIGADIVEDLVNKLTQSHSNDNISFENLDLTKDELPKVDLIICRDCLVHLSYDDIFKSLKNIKKSGSKYLLTTSFVEYPFNYDINTGEWRAINLTKKPFLLSNPIKTLNENCKENDGLAKDKSLCLWEISSI